MLVVTKPRIHSINGVVDRYELWQTIGMEINVLHERMHERPIWCFNKRCSLLFTNGFIWGRSPVKILNCRDRKKTCGNAIFLAFLSACNHAFLRGASFVVVSQTPIHGYRSISHPTGSSARNWRRIGWKQTTYLENNLYGK